MKRKHQITLRKIYDRPVSGSIKWSDIEALLESLGATFEEREGSRVGIDLSGCPVKPCPSGRGYKGRTALLS